MEKGKIRGPIGRPPKYRCPNPACRGRGALLSFRYKTRTILCKKCGKLRPMADYFIGKKAKKVETKAK